MTKTAQMAICKPSRTSRSVKRRVLPTLVAPGANDLPGIGAENLADRDQAEEQPTEDSQQEGQSVGVHVRIDRYIDRDIRNRPPCAEGTQDDHGSRRATNTSSQRDQNAFREELAEDELAARSQSHADCDFACAIRRPRGEQATKIGACGKQDKTCEEHESEHKSARGSTEGISGESGAGQGEFQAIIGFGIGFRQRICNGVQVRSSCGWRYSGLEVSYRPGVMVAALLERIPISDLGRIDDGSPQIGREKKFGAAEVRPEQRR